MNLKRSSRVISNQCCFHLFLYSSSSNPFHAPNNHHFIKFPFFTRCRFCTWETGYVSHHSRTLTHPTFKFPLHRPGPILIKKKNEAASGWNYVHYNVIWICEKKTEMEWGEKRKIKRNNVKRTKLFSYPPFCWTLAIETHMRQFALTFYFHFSFDFFYWKCSFYKWVFS